MTSQTADWRGEGFAFFRWHCLHCPYQRCDGRNHAYHLNYWKWGYR